MVTCRDVITLALRQLGVVALDDEPTAAEAAHGLTLLQSYYDGLFNGGALSPATRKQISEDYTAGESEHITALSDTITITIPDEYVDECTHETRAPKEWSSVVISTGGIETNYVYSGGTWQGATGLAQSDEAPLASNDTLGLACTLAEQFVGPFGGELSRGDVMASRRFTARLLYQDGNTNSPTPDYF